LSIDVTDYLKGDKITLSIIHGEKPHTILIHIDANGNLVGVESIKQVIALTGAVEEAKVVRILSLKELVELFGTSTIATILTAFKKRIPVYFVSGKTLDWALEIAYSIASGFKLNVDITVNQVSSRPAFYVINEELYAERRGEVEKGLLLSTIGGLFGNIPKPDKKILDILKKRLGEVERNYRKDLEELF